MINSSMDFGLKSGGPSLETNKSRELRENLLSEKSSPAGDGKEPTFGDFLKSLAQEANSSQLYADQKLNEVASGRNKDLHGAVIAMEKADVNFRLLAQVRNKVIEAYREVLRMQV